MWKGPADIADPVCCPAALLGLAIVFGLVPAAISGQSEVGAPPEPGPQTAPASDRTPPSETISFSARRLSPSDHDAVRPAFTADGTRVAYVRIPPPGPSGTPAPPAGSPAETASRPPASTSGAPPAAGDETLPATTARESAGEEIWILEVSSGAARRLVGSGNLARAGLIAARPTLLDLAWSPAGDRLAFTWYDGDGWGQIAFADPNGEVLPLPVPVMADRWEGGALYDLSASQFLWDAEGRSGTFVAWDEDCGSLYRAAVPAPGSWPGLPVGPGDQGAGEPPETPMPLPLPQGCRPLLLGTPGFWLYTEFDETFSQRLVVADDRGSEMEEITFPQGRPLRVRWGSAKGRERIVVAAPPGPPGPEAAAPLAPALGGPAAGEARRLAPSSRPPVAGWWYETDRHERVLFTWAPGEIREWRRESCPADCADPVALTESALLTLEGAPSSARLVAATGPLAPPREVLPAPVEDLAIAPDGRSVLAVCVDGGRRSIWMLEPR